MLWGFFPLSHFKKQRTGRRNICVLKISKVSFLNVIEYYDIP